MKLAAILAGSVTLGLAGTAMAQSACVRPPAPPAVDGAAATIEQLVAAKNGVASFMDASDAYQTCVLDGLSSQRAAAKASKTRFDPAIAKAAEAQIEANQADKENVAKAFNAAAKAYKAAHPS